MKSVYAWCTSPYVKEIHNYLRLKETTRIVIKFTSPQSLSRGEIVDWIRTVGQTYKFPISAVHLAVYILDLFMDTHDITRECFGAVGIVSLWIASKYECPVEVLPKSMWLIAMSIDHFGHVVKASTVVTLERFMLRSLHWRLEWPTAASFSEYYRLFVIVNGDRDRENTPHEELSKKVQLSFDHFLDKCLQSIQLVNIRPSRTAAGVLLAARSSSGVYPVWPDSIQKLTSSCYSEVYQIADQLLTRFTDDADSGYSSSPNSSRETC